MQLRSVAVAAALVGSLAAPRLVAQGDAAYLALLDAYVRGESREAATVLASWPDARARIAVRSLDSQLSPARLRAAIMLHTESAFQIDDGEFHLDLARSYLRRLLDAPALADPAAKDFAARWHAFTAEMYCARDDVRKAQTEIDHGLALDGDHSYVNLVANALIEYRRNELMVDGAEWQLAYASERAMRGYRIIISKHPDFFEAHIRLGRMLQPNGEEPLALVIAQAPSADMVYLAHMFLADLHTRANRPAEAEREYEAARAVAPYPSSLITLVQIALMRGQDERARSLAAEVPAMAAGKQDPWSHYTMCSTGGNLIEGLRADGRRP